MTSGLRDQSAAQCNRLCTHWVHDCSELYFLFRIVMRYNKTYRDCCYRSLLEIVSPQFGKYYPLGKLRGNNFQ